MIIYSKILDNRARLAHHPSTYEITWNEFIRTIKNTMFDQQCLALHNNYKRYYIYESTYKIKSFFTVFVLSALLTLPYAFFSYIHDPVTYVKASNNNQKENSRGYLDYFTSIIFVTEAVASPVFILIQVCLNIIILNCCQYQQWSL